MTKKTYTTEDYDNLSWHDNIIHSISMIDENYESDLILGIDFISKWVCDDSKCEFMIAPANLVFHDVEDFKLIINKISGCTMHSYLGLIIDDIIREKTPNKVKNKELWKFKFFNSGDNGTNELSFLSSGFTQTLLKEPILKDQQTLISSER